jgi:hypothetical protein
MSAQIETGEREVVLLEDAHIRPMMGLDILEPLPSRTIPYAQVDPFILVHEAVVPITEERASMDTKHPTEGSTTCGTCSRARPVPATAPVQVAQWSVRGCRPDRS